MIVFSSSVGNCEAAEYLCQGMEWVCKVPWPTEHQEPWPEENEAQGKTNYQKGWKPVKRLGLMVLGSF